MYIYIYIVYSIYIPQPFPFSFRHLFSGYVNFIGPDFGLDGLEAANSDRYLQQALWVAGAREEFSINKGKFIGKYRKSIGTYRKSIWKHRKVMWKYRNGIWKCRKTIRKTMGQLL